MAKVKVFQKKVKFKCQGHKVNKSNANVAKYTRRVNLRGKQSIIGNIKGFYLVLKA